MAYTDEGKAKRFLGVHRDISEEKALEAKLQQSQKMEAIGTLSGGIAHEFNNILSIIMGNAELAVDDLPPLNPAQDLLKEILKATLRGKTIVQQLLTFSHPAVPKYKPIEVGKTVKETLKLLKATVPSSVRFNIQIADACDIINGNAVQIHQVVVNLVNNSLHSMKDGKGILGIGVKNIQIDEQITFSGLTLSPGTHVCLQVSDNGTGIPPEHLEKMFDPFFTTKEIGIGTGMGLAVVHGIVKGHGGAIRVESRPNEGTTVQCYFPSLKVATEEVHPEIAPTISGGSERILYIDDEESIAKVEKMRLERLGYQVETTTNPFSAVQLFDTAEKTFDLVITDLTMPGITGDQVIVEIRKRKPETKMILCTGYDEKPAPEKAKEVDADAFISKPVPLNELASTLRKVLDT